MHSTTPHHFAAFIVNVAPALDNLQKDAFSVVTSSSPMTSGSKSANTMLFTGINQSTLPNRGALPPPPALFQKKDQKTVSFTPSMNHLSTTSPSLPVTNSPPINDTSTTNPPLRVLSDGNLSAPTATTHAVLDHLVATFPDLAADLAPEDLQLASLN